MNAAARKRISAVVVFAEKEENITPENSDVVVGDNICHVCPLGMGYRVVYSLKRGGDDVFSSGLWLPHAFNRLGDQYFDVTADFCLREHERFESYRLLVEFGREKIMSFGTRWWQRLRYPKMGHQDVACYNKYIKNCCP